MQGESYSQPRQGASSGRRRKMLGETRPASLRAPPSGGSVRRSFGAVRKLQPSYRRLQGIERFPELHLACVTFEALNSRSSGRAEHETDLIPYRPSRKSPSRSRSSQSGTLTAPPRNRRPATTPMSTSGQWRCTPTRSVSATTSSCSLSAGCPTASRTPTTSVTMRRS